MLELRPNCENCNKNLLLNQPMRIYVHTSVLFAQVVLKIFYKMFAQIVVVVSLLGLFDLLKSVEKE